MPSAGEELAGARDLGAERGALSRLLVINAIAWLQQTYAHQIAPELAHFVSA